MSDLQGVRLSPEAFRAVAHEKGWTWVALAARWGLTAVWVSALARNPERPAHYDDALLGLPNRKFLTQENARRRNQVTRLLAQHQARKDKRPVRPVVLDPYVPGAILTAEREVGSMLYEGERAVMVQAQGAGPQRRYLVLGESGGFDWFRPEDMAYYFAETGLQDPNYDRYGDANEGNLATLLAEGFFTFG